MTAFNVAAKALNGKTDRSVCLRVKPNKTSQSIRRLMAGDQLQVIAVGKTWDKVVDLTTGQTGYVASAYMTPCETENPEGNTGKNVFGTERTESLPPGRNRREHP